MDENDPELKLKLLEVAKAAAPDYPDVKKGVGCGLTALVAGGVFAAVLVSFFQNLAVGSKISLITGTALIAAIIAGGLAAFRPPKQ